MAVPDGRGSIGNRFDMTSSCTSERWTLGAALFVLISQMLLPSGSVRAAVAPDVLLQPTPLVLKDGRIANVSIHVLPFDSGNGQLADEVASRLAEITAALATDCFLTAQVIGHVSSREVAENETLAAHRLARARADTVQAALIGSGLPAKAIASVWDWQFLVREPRATLWMFRLIQGEDCEGLPLDGSAAPLVAADEPPGEPAGASTAAAAPQPAQEIAQAPQALAPPASPATQTEAVPAATPPAQRAPDLAGMVGSAVAAEPPAPAASERVATAASQAHDGAAVASAAPVGNDAQAAEQAEPTAVAAGPAPEAVPALTRPLPALDPAPAQPQHSGETTVAAVESQPAAAAGKAQRGAAVAPQHPDRQGKVEWGQDNVVITFATNSSYFPPGTTRRLRTLLGNLAADGRYRVQLEVGVSGSDTVVGAKSPEEARQYNRWLAERRLDRVREWLGDNAAGRQIEIEPAFQPDDNSRRVVVRVAPVG
jgi:outer membrane protein OmpA-like peptidoglycan-associated protein